MPTFTPTTIRIPPPFTVVPSPLNKTTEQGAAVFYCQHNSSDDIAWRVNRTSYNSLNITRTPLRDGGFQSSLTINTHLDFSETTVQCVASFFQGPTPFLFSASVLLLIQGLLISEFPLVNTRITFINVNHAMHVALRPLEMYIVCVYMSIVYIAM